MVAPSLVSAAQRCIRARVESRGLGLRIGPGIRCP